MEKKEARAVVWPDAKIVKFMAAVKTRGLLGKGRISEDKWKEILIEVQEAIPPEEKPDRWQPYRERCSKVQTLGTVRLFFCCAVLYSSGCRLVVSHISHRVRSFITAFAVLFSFTFLALHCSEMCFRCGNACRRQNQPAQGGGTRVR